LTTHALTPTDRNTTATAVSTEFPFLDLRAQFAMIREEVTAAVARVLESQNLILGPEVELLEKEFAAYTQAPFAVGCASGSDALLLSMMALDIGSGDEVITTPFTFGATAGSIARLRARPVFVDIHPKTFNINAGQLERAISSKTRAIMPVHLFGLPADMDTVTRISQAHNLPVIEDAAQAVGSRWKGRTIGTLGRFGCFSFFPSKNLGGAGDGGIITVKDAAQAERLRMLRVHGCRKKYQYEFVGVNSRLDALQACILRVKLRYLDDWTQARRRNALRYRELFVDHGLEGIIQIPEETPGSDHVFNQYVLRAPRRNALQEYLHQQGIPTEIYYPSPLHLQPAFSDLGYKAGDFPEAERTCHEVLALPVYAELTADRQRKIVVAIADFYQKARRAEDDESEWSMPERRGPGEWLLG
jgi:dTDP-4-amino-4,6-dideoxygalactose transaminase